MQRNRGGSLINGIMLRMVTPLKKDGLSAYKQKWKTKTISLINKKR